MKAKHILALFLMMIAFASIGQRKMPDPAKAAERQSTQLKERFAEKEMALEDEVYSQLQAINLKYAEKMKDLREENKGNREGMREAMEGLEAEKRKEFKKILSKDQFKEYKAWAEERRTEMRERRGRP